MLDMFDTDQLASVSSYQNYPSSKPFINTEWSRSNPTNLSKAFPESNRDEIINSLRKLQEKLVRLETEQKSEQQLANNQRDVNTDSVYVAYPIKNGFQVASSYVYEDNTTHPNLVTNFNKTIYSTTNDSFNEPPPYLKHIENIDQKAISTEKRVLELEKQLERMRKLIRDDSESTLVNNNFKKQSKYSDKKKRQIDNVIVESDTTLHDVDQVFSSNDDNSSQKIKTNRSKNKSITIKSKTKQDPFDLELRTSNKCILNRSRSADDHHIQLKPHQHFKLNLGDIPFVVGKSTTPSHHLGTNIQNVFSLLKQHHPKLCTKFNSSCKSSESNLTSSTSSKTNRYHQCRRTRCSAPLDNHLVDETKVKRSKSTPLSTLVDGLEKSVELNYMNEKKNKKQVSKEPARDVDSTKEQSQSKKNNSSIDESLMNNVDWNELLRILQEEYTKLVLHHYDLTKKIINCIDDKKRSEYEMKAEYLHKKMKTKAKQINKLKAIQQCKTSSSCTNINKKTSSVEYQNQKSDLFTSNSTTHSSPHKSSYNCLKSQQQTNFLNNFNNSNTNNSLSFMSTLIDKQVAQTMNPKTLKLFKDIKSFQNKFQTN